MRQRSWVGALLAMLCLQAALWAGSGEDFEKARALASAEAVTELHELVAWCKDEKLYGLRYDTLSSILVLAPDDEAARKELGHKRRKGGGWSYPTKSRRPRDHNEEAMPEFAKQRGRIVDRLRSQLLEAAEAAELPSVERRSVFEDLLKLDEDDADTRYLLGEGRRGEAWVLLEVLRSDERRAELDASVADAFARPVTSTASSVNAREQTIGLPYTAVYETPDGRVLGTVPADELQRSGILLAAMRRHLVGVFGRDARYGENCTIYVLQPVHKDAYIDGVPDLDADYRKFMRPLLGSGIQGADDLAQWGPSEADRRDMLVREGVGWLFADAFGITTAQGWAHEGFGLYFSKQLVNTRLHWFARPSEYGRVEDDEALRNRMAGGKTDWLLEALLLLQAEQAPKLQFLLGKDVNRMTTPELLVSHALAAYLIEGRPEQLPAIWTAIGEGQPSPQVLERELGTDLTRLQAILVRWLEEREGEGGEAPGGGPKEKGKFMQGPLNTANPGTVCRDSTVRWDGRPYVIDELPDELGGAPRKAAQAWAAWCEENGYAMELDESGRVLLVTARGSKKLTKARALVKKTSAFFDKILPAPIETEGRSGESAGWGGGATPLDHETAVLFVLSDVKDQGKLLDELAKQHGYLSGWAQGAKSLVGFVLEEPLVGAYLESAPNLEEWRPENELVHRLTELLFLRRFGRQPWWLQQGVAWNVEIALEKGVYCFPYRNEFIYEVEHAAWPSNVKALYHRQGKDIKPLDLERLTNWHRSSFNAQAALTAWGAAHFLINEHGDQLPVFLRDLHRFRDQHDRVDNGDGTWQRMLGYEIPLDSMREKLEQYFGADVLADAGKYLGKGKAK